MTIRTILRAVAALACLWAPVAGAQTVVQGAGLPFSAIPSSIPSTSPTCGTAGPAVQDCGNVNTIVNQSVTHPTSGPVTAYANQYVVNDTVAGTTNYIQEGVRINVNTSGTCTLSSGGHDVGIQVESYAGIAQQDLAVSVEGVTANTYNGGTLTNAWTFLSKLASNNGTIGNYFGYNTLVNNNGVIGNFYQYYCQPLTGGGSVSQVKACLYNNDPTQAIQTNGPIYGISGELSAPPIAAPYPGRYYWGINHGAASGTITNLNTNTYYAPFLMPIEQGFGHFGIHIVTPVTGSTCSVAVYYSYYGFPSQPIAFGPYSLSAASSGDVETNSYYAVNSGLYWLGVNCSSNSVVIQGYTENQAFALSGASSSGGADTTPITAGTAFPTSPTISYISNSSVYPQIWLRR